VLPVYTDPRCLEHRAPRGFPERAERVASIVAHLAAQGWPVLEVGEAAASGRRENEPQAETSLEPPAAAWEAVCRLHDPAYVERFRRAVERGDGLLDSADNPLSEGTWRAAWGAVEATLAAAAWVAGGDRRRAFAAVRPPGHHAERDLAMGFCFFNNVAVAAEELRARHGAERLAIVDFDVHHGNGTQHLFESRADVFYASTHQYPFYPGTGAASETGIGAGEGTTLNVPLPAGAGDRELEAALRGRVIPALRRFAPEVLLVSAGFDVWRGDPLGGLAVSEEGFAQCGVWLAELAEEVCRGRALAVLEGGYDLAHLPLLVETHLRALGAPRRGLAPELTSPRP
jgi:acetoin utilization deacetylase AcuC-like enzyme